MQETEKDDDEEAEESCSHQRRRRSDALERYQSQLLDHLVQISSRVSELEEKS